MFRQQSKYTLTSMLRSAKAEKARTLKAESNAHYKEIKRQTDEIQLRERKLRFMQGRKESDRIKQIALDAAQAQADRQRQQRQAIASATRARQTQVIAARERQASAQAARAQHVQASQERELLARAKNAKETCLSTCSKNLNTRNASDAIDLRGRYGNARYYW